MRAYGSQPDEWPAHRWPHRILRSWTGSDDTTPGVNELAGTGSSPNAIGRRRQLDRKTVRRYRNKDPAG